MSEAFYIAIKHHDDRIFKRWMWVDERFFPPEEIYSDDVLSWLKKYAGENRWSDQQVRTPNMQSYSHYEFGFLDRRTAMLFKLRYGETD